MGFVYLILAAIFPLTLGASSMGGIQAKAILTGVSARTYFMTLLLAAIGAFFGYLLAQYASDSNNVFTAAWKWAHRTRGFVRTLLDAAFIYAVVFYTKIVPVECLKLLTAIIVALAIAAPSIQRWAAFQRRKAAAKGKEGN